MAQCRRSDERAKQATASSRKGVVGKIGSTTPTAPTTTKATPMLMHSQRIHGARAGHAADASVLVRVGTEVSLTGASIGHVYKSAEAALAA